MVDSLDRIAEAPVWGKIFGDFDLMPEDIEYPEGGDADDHLSDAQGEEAPDIRDCDIQESPRSTKLTSMRRPAMLLGVGRGQEAEHGGAVQAQGHLMPPVQGR